MTCGLCRQQLAQDHLRPPCEAGGLDACRFLPTHGMSPGEVEDFEDTLAIALYLEGRLMGFDAMLQLRHLELTAAAVERLCWRLTWLAAHYPAYERAAAGGA
jgi:hypothetical protein